VFPGKYFRDSASSPPQFLRPGRTKQDVIEALKKAVPSPPGDGPRLGPEPGRPEEGRLVHARRHHLPTDQQPTIPCAPR